MPVFASNNNNACGPCSDNGGESSGQSLFLGTFPSLSNLSTLHPSPEPGSRALITVAGAADDIAFWDAGDNAWRVSGSNNKVRLISAGITDAPFPSNSIINFPQSLTVLPDEIVVVSLIRILPPPSGSVNSVHTKERYLWGKGKGTFAPIGNVTIGSDIVYIGNEVISQEDISNIPNTVTRDIGIVPEGQTLEAYINNLGPGDLIDLTDETKSYFLSFEQGEVTKLAAFAGDSSANGFGWYGSSSFGGLQATAGDFSIIGTDLSGPPPNLNVVTQEGNQSQVPLVVANDNDDLGKTVYGADRMTYSNTFFDREYFLNPEAGGMNTIARMADVILRTGTIEGYPIRGTFDIDGTDSTPFFLRKVVAGVGTMYLAIADGIVNLSCFLGTGQGVQFDITPDGISFQSTKPGSKGLSSAQDFSGVVTALDYVQKKYVDQHGNLKNSTVDSSPLTGTTTESVMATCTIPANYLSAGRLSIEMPFTKGGSNDILSVKLYRNSTPDLSGSPTLLAAFNTTATTRFVPFKRDFWLKAAGTLWGYNATNSANVDGLSATSLVPQTTSFAFNSTFHLVVSAQLVNSGDSATSNGLRVKFEKSI